MKGILLSISIGTLCFIFYKNGSNTNQIKTTFQEEKKEQNLSFNYDTYVEVYRYNETYKDSSLLSKIWRLEDSIIKKEGDFQYKIPLQSHFVTNNIIKAANGKKELEMFDESICETRDTGVWNKYLISYNKKSEPIAIKHYKTSCNKALESIKRPNQSEYFLGEEIEFLHEYNRMTQYTYDDTGKFLEKIIKKYDTKHQLISEEYEAQKTHRFKIFYVYRSN